MTELERMMEAAVDLRGATAGGLPYPETTGPLNQGANDIKALALAVDAQVAGPWLSVAPAAGFTTSTGLYIRKEGAGVVLSGSVQGTYTGGPTIFSIPAGYRPVFPGGSGQTYFVFSVAANQSGNAGTITVRIWADGSVTLVAVNGTITSVDYSSIRYSIRNG